MPRPLLAALLALTLSITSGCTVFQKGSASVVKYDDDQPPREVTAPMSATYSLYGAQDVEPKVTVQLSEGDAIGFRLNDETGQVVAIAGGSEWRLTDGGDYYWRRR
jgi:hypothetical protein